MVQLISESSQNNGRRCAPGSKNKQLSLAGPLRKPLGDQLRESWTHSNYKNRGNYREVVDRMT